MPRKTKQDRAALWALGVLSFAAQIPFLNRGISTIDEGSLLAIAQALSDGEILYRDRATFIAPLAYELMRALIEVFGAHLLVGRVLGAVVFTLCVLLTYGILREFAPPRWAVLGAIALFPVKSLAFPLWTIPNYSQLGMLLSLASVAATLRFLASNRPAWLAAAGVAVGATILTKQSLGAAVGAATAATVGLDALYRRGSVLASLVARGSTLVASAAAPVLAAFVYYGVHGALPDFFDRAIVALLDIASGFRVPLPGIGLWLLDPERRAELSFRYFPTSILALMWQGRLDIASRPVAFLIEYGVKAAYYVPLLALAAAAVTILRDLRSTVSPAMRGRLVLIATFAATAYWSIAYRADFTHLLSVAPPLVILCVATLHRLLSGSRLGIGCSILIAGTWLLAGLVGASCVFAVWDTPVDTPHGRLFAIKNRAGNVARLLAYLDAQPKNEKILIAPIDPLYYFLSDRPIPGRFDLLLPGYLRPGDDERLARSLSDVDQVVYNPKIIPTVPTPLTAIAPRTAAELAHRFHFVKVLDPEAYVMRPREGRTDAEETIVDFWSDFEPLSHQRREEKVELTSWMMYRVITTTVTPAGLRTCFRVTQDVEPGQSLSVFPMLHPETWKPRWSTDSTRSALFEIRVSSPSLGSRVVFSEERRAGPPSEVVIALDPFVGRGTEIEFCAFRLDQQRGGRSEIRAGWGEPRIVRRKGLGDKEGVERPTLSGARVPIAAKIKGETRQAVMPMSP